MAINPDNHIIEQDKFLEEFKCLADKCPDPCCSGWDMQLDRITKAMYEMVYTDLKDVVSSNENNFILKRDKKDNCTMLDNKGLCKIHKKYGEKALSDACYFYPRNFFKFGNEFKVSAGFSCPEITRLILFGENPFIKSATRYDRIPYVLKDYSNLNITSTQIKKIHNYFVNRILNFDLVNNLIFLLMIARSLNNLDMIKWPSAIENLDNIVNNISPESEHHHNNHYYLIQLLVITITKCAKKPNDNFMKILSQAEYLLDFKIDWETTNIIVEHDNYNLSNVTNKIDPYKQEFIKHVMSRWIMGQMSNFFYPFSGIGGNILEKTQILLVKYCLNQLLLMVSLANSNDLEKDAICTIQSVAKFMDHLSDDKLINILIASYHWNEDNKLIGLIKDICLMPEVNQCY